MPNILLGIVPSRKAAVEDINVEVDEMPEMGLGLIGLWQPEVGAFENSKLSLAEDFYQSQLVWTLLKGVGRDEQKTAGAVSPDELTTPADNAGKQQPLALQQLLLLEARDREERRRQREDPGSSRPASDLFAEPSLQRKSITLLTAARRYLQKFFAVGGVYMLPGRGGGGPNKYETKSHPSPRSYPCAA